MQEYWGRGCLFFSYLEHIKDTNPMDSNIALKKAKSSLDLALCSICNFRLFYTLLGIPFALTGLPSGVVPLVCRLPFDVK